jgi:hypothetical protein
MTNYSAIKFKSVDNKVEKKVCYVFIFRPKRKITQVYPILPPQIQRGRASIVAHLSM